MKSVAVFGIVCLLGIAGNCADWARAQGKIEALDFKPLVIFSGADSHVDKASAERADSAGELDRIWARHLGTSVDDAYRPAMEVDFDRCMVVAIFRGAQVNVRGIRVASVSESEGAIRLRFSELGYQTAGKDNDHPADRSYAFVVLPKSVNRIVLEENVQQYKGHPPEWREWKRIEAISTGR